jgi:Serine dehydrogenase proteinase
VSGYQDRKKIIEEIQKKRNSFILTYFGLTDRANAPQFLVADDAVRPLHQILERAGHKESIDFFIYTRGGSMMTAYNIVKLLREYATKLNVIVPYRAHSAGTQIALGGDSVVMTRLAQLSPVDPSTANMFNPLLNPAGNPADGRNRKPISVEDVQAYQHLAKDQMGLVSEEDRLQVFKELTRYYEPLALGNVNRVYMETRLIAREVLSLHMDVEKDEDRIDRIIKALTETYTHDFLITRDVAEKIGLSVVRPNVEEEALIMKLYESYEEELRMNVPFDAESILADHAQQPVSPPAAQPAQPAGPPIAAPQPQALQTHASSPVKFKIKLASIESHDESFVWVTDGLIAPPQQGGTQVPFGVPMALPSSGVPTITFKLGRWYRSAELGGLGFE